MDRVPAVPALKVETIVDGKTIAEQLVYGDASIGRDPGCDIFLDFETVSRRHAFARWTPRGWILDEQKSTNGLCVNNIQVYQLLLDFTKIVRLGKHGPQLRFSLHTSMAEDASLATLVEPRKSSLGSSSNRLLPQDPPNSEPADEHERNVSVTEIIRAIKGNASSSKSAPNLVQLREATQRILHEEKRSSRKTLAVVGFVALVLIGIMAIYTNTHRERNLELSRQMFYKMKELELKIGQAQQWKLQDDLRHSQAEYDRIVKELSVYDGYDTEEERLIVKIARKFGEYDGQVPPEFIKEVRSRIPEWVRSGRFQNQMRRARKDGYIEPTVQVLRERHLPPEFIYLALQESNFDPTKVGPITRWGYAKGAWQFLAATAQDYGLKIAPGKGSTDFDPEDERHDPAKSTLAAAAHLDRLYTTHAAASGLLVMACYNWGEGNVESRLEVMEKSFFDNVSGAPQERNFWNLLQHFRKSIPIETYNYVFMIVAAAAIGENPSYFGIQITEPIIPP